MIVRRSVRHSGFGCGHAPNNEDRVILGYAQGAGLRRNQSIAYDGRAGSWSTKGMRPVGDATNPIFATQLSGFHRGIIPSQCQLTYGYVRQTDHLITVIVIERPNRKLYTENLETFPTTA